MGWNPNIDHGPPGPSNFVRSDPTPRRANRWRRWAGRPPYTGAEWASLRALFADFDARTAHLPEVDY